jgi:hypothetical protein
MCRGCESQLRGHRPTGRPIASDGRRVRCACARSADRQPAAVVAGGKGSPSCAADGRRHLGPSTCSRRSRANRCVRPTPGDAERFKGTTRRWTLTETDIQCRRGIPEDIFSAVIKCASKGEQCAGTGRSRRIALSVESQAGCEPLALHAVPTGFSCTQDVFGPGREPCVEANGVYDGLGTLETATPVTQRGGCEKHGRRKDSMDAHEDSAISTTKFRNRTSRSARGGGTHGTRALLLRAGASSCVSWAIARRTAEHNGAADSRTR